VRIGRILGIEHNLGDAVAIAQVKKCKFTEVAALRHPTHQGHKLAYVIRSQSAA
jgi:hypothetical protein